MYFCANLKALFEDVYYTPPLTNKWNNRCEIIHTFVTSLYFVTLRFNRQCQIIDDDDNKLGCYCEFNITVTKKKHRHFKIEN